MRSSKRAARLAWKRTSRRRTVSGAEPFSDRELRYDVLRWRVRSRMHLQHTHYQGRSRNGELLHSFSGPDGDYPIAGLIDVKGVLYGTTVSGGEGSNGRGTVFSITTSGTENLLHTFAGGPYDGSDPYGNVTYNHGTFYGTTYTGGAYRGFRRLGGGTVFSVTASGAEKVLHSFGKVMNNGASPMAGVIYVRGTLYGTTQEGGHRGCGGSTRDCGTVFALTP